MKPRCDDCGRQLSIINPGSLCGICKTRRAEKAGDE